MMLVSLYGVLLAPIVATASLRPRLASVPEFTGANSLNALPSSAAYKLYPINSPICQAICAVGGYGRPSGAKTTALSPATNTFL